ncbi:hypothetical protein [Acidicapsa ligni]|uniref:hypothetical protein n=1 Tax=Acidicapsa ligni TaxID=542300 RepID=UPI0021E0E194|nr:hypothetical protein [Acidicapsa ligni]
MKRKTAQSNSNSRTRPSQSASAGLQEAIHGSLYSEVTGKIVDYIRYADQSSGWPAFEIRFTDGMFLLIEPLPRVEFRVRFLKTTGGNIETLRDYGVLPGPPSGE